MSQPTACIIGAASGIGHATAAELGQRGYALILADLSQERLQPLAEQFGAATYAVDMTDPASVERLAADLPILDAFVITAGLSPSMAAFERIIEVNLSATAAAIEQLHPRMRAGGAVIAIASMTAHTVPFLQPEVVALLDQPERRDLGRVIADHVGKDAALPGLGYALSKFAILRLVRRLAAPLGAKGLRICSVSPGCIDTPMGQLEMGQSPTSQQALAFAPIPRSGMPEEVARAIAFLASCDASYITGCDLQVDGGWVGATLAGTGDSSLNAALAAGRAKT